MSAVRIDLEGSESLNRVNKILTLFPGAAFKAAHAALKRAGETARSKAGQFAAEEYTINQGTFTRNVRVKARVSGSSGSVATMDVLFAGNVLPLLEFNTNYTKDGLVQTQVKRNGGAASLERAFVARISGRTAVLERVGAQRYPIEQKFGPSTAHMLQNEQVTENMEKNIRQTYEARIEHEILRVMNGW